MSSHHFVREGQEPALYITHHEPQSHPYFTQLAAWNPVIICSGRVVPFLDTFGYSWEHALVEESDAAFLDVYSFDQTKHIHIIKKNQAGPELARILEGFQCRSLRLLTDDSSNFQNWEKIASCVPLSVITPEVYWIHIPNGSHHKWMPAGSRVVLESHYPISLNGDSFKPGNTWQSKVDGRVEVRADGPFWWGEFLGG